MGNSKLQIVEENMNLAPNEIKKELKNILIGTEYECKSAEIIDFVSAKRHQGKKALYTGALHQFGRKDGRKIYQLLKRKMSE